jgi:hypothetical protein
MDMNRKFAFTGVVFAALAMGACTTSKSLDPLSPTVAGPIPGVTISAPGVMQPASGTKIAVDQQPLSLVVVNAATSGVRPLTYLFEIAADASFVNVVFTRDGISPGSGQTSLKLPDSLAPARTYFWHARAQDGANTGPFSSTASFDVFTPIVISAPVATAPIGNVRIDSLHPRFSWSNAPRSGPVGAVTYIIEVSDTDSFASKVAIWTTGEQPGQTSFDAPADLPANKQLFWHVRAADPTTLGPFSANQAFQTPAVAVAPTPTPVPTPGGPSGPAPGDSLDMTQASIWNSPRDLGFWAVTAKITSVVFTSGAFLVDFDKRLGPGRWPDVPFGDGNLEYTLGMCLSSGAHWDCSAVVQFWYGRDLSASAPPSQIASAWFYDGRWGALAGRQPADGETVGIFVCAGNCRNNTIGDASYVHERSNVQFVKWSNGGGTGYTFSTGPRVTVTSRP